MAVSPVRLETRSGWAGKDQQQFSQPGFSDGFCHSVVTFSVTNYNGVLRKLIFFNWVGDLLLCETACRLALALLLNIVVVWIVTLFSLAGKY